jgi:hypothetical protein
MRTPLHTAAALALATSLTVLLGACGTDAARPADARPSSTMTATASPSARGTEGGAPDGTTEPTAAPPWQHAKPADGRTFRGQGFSFRAPKGWTDETEKAQQLNQLVDLAAAAAPDRSGFATNVNVVVSDAGVEDPSDDQLRQISAAIKSRLSTLVPELTVNPLTQLDGRPTLDHEGPATKQGMPYYIHQYVAFDAGNAYTVTFSFSRESKPAQRQQVIDQILASWSWAGS